MAIDRKKKKKEQNKMMMYLAGIVYLFVLFYSLHVGTVMTITHETNIFNAFIKGLTHMEQYPFQFAFSLSTLTAFLICTFIFIFAVAWIHYDGIVNGSETDKQSGGTAKWNDNWKGYNKTFTDPKGKETHEGPKNMILTQNIFMSMDTRQTLRNNNVLVVGGSGAGKSRFMVKPNILQANCNYVITDPAGELLTSTGKFLEKEGYTIKVFNLVEMQKSDQYNPFNYIRDEVGVLMMINCLIRNTNPEGKSGGDPFWEKSETALLQALVFYLVKYRPKSEQNFTSVMKLLRAAEVDENNPNKKSKLDCLFDEVAKRDPNSIALKQYLTFKMGAGKTLKSILISTSVRLTVFNMKQIENLTSSDTIELGKMGEGKKALFVIIPAADSTYNFLVSMMYSQLFETLYYVAETNGKGRLDSPVRFLLDEFANIGQIPEFTKKLATMRKYEISCTIILQNLAQIKTMYKDDWESIVGNCDSFLFLGGQEYSTLEYISKELGEETNKVKNTNRSRGKSGSSGHGINQGGRPLAKPDELARMDNSECILIIRGLFPFNDKKFDYVKHKNYCFTGDADKRFNYVNTRDNRKKKSREELEVEYQKYKAALFSKATNSDNPEDAVLHTCNEIEIKSIIDTIGDIKDIENVKSKIEIYAPEGFVKLPEQNWNEDRKYKEMMENLVSSPEQHTPILPLNNSNSSNEADDELIFVEE